MQQLVRELTELRQLGGQPRALDRFDPFVGEIQLLELRLQPLPALGRARQVDRVYLPRLIVLGHRESCHARGIEPEDSPANLNVLDSLSAQRKPAI